MSASVARGRGRDEEKSERGIGHIRNMGPQRDMGEELGSKGGRDNDDHDHHPASPIPMHPGTKHVVRKLNLQFTRAPCHLQTQGHKSNSAYAMDLFWASNSNTTAFAI